MVFFAALLLMVYAWVPLICVSYVAAECIMIVVITVLAAFGLDWWFGFWCVGLDFGL